MRYFSIFIMAVIVGLGFMVLNADQASAQDECEITIVKSANPAINTGFDFLVTGGPLSFVLRDPSDDTHVINILAGDDGNPATVTEDLPSGWELDNIECTPPTGGFCGPTPCLNITDAPDGINIECFDSGEATCTFFNSLPPHNVPTLSQYGLIAMAGVLGFVAFMVIRRKKLAA